MATACGYTVAMVRELVALGELDPQHIVTPGIFVRKVVKIDRLATSAGGFEKAA